MKEVDKLDLIEEHMLEYLNGISYHDSMDYAIGVDNAVNHLIHFINTLRGDKEDETEN